MSRLSTIQFETKKPLVYDTFYTFLSAHKRFLCIFACGYQPMNRRAAFFIFLFLTSACAAQVRHFGPAEGLHTGEVVQVVELPNGQILVNTVGEFRLFDGTGFVPLSCDAHHRHALPSFGAYGHLWQGDSLLWLRDFYSLYLFDARKRCFRCDIAPRLSDTNVWAFSQGRIGDEQPPHRQWTDTLRHHGLSGICRISTVCEDRHHGVWIGTHRNNLFYLAPPRPQAHTFACPNGKAAQVIGVTSTDQLLVGTEEGLWLFDTETQRFTSLKSETGALYHSITSDREGRTWICSQHGIDCYDGRALSHYDANRIAGFLHDHVFFVRELSDGRLLTCNNLHELGFLDVERGLFQSLNSRLPELESYRVIIDAQPLSQGDKVLVLSQNGAFRLDCSTARIAPCPPLPDGLSDKFNCAHTDTDNRLWVGTQNGLACITDDSVSSRILMNGCIRGIASDSYRRLWVIASDGLYRINPFSSDNASHICRFSTADGIPSDGFSERGLALTAHGTLCMAGANGITMLDVHLYDSLRKELPTVLTGCSVGIRDIPLDLPATTLSHSDRDLQWKFSALNLTAPEHTHYRYRLCGFNDRWTYTDEGRAAYTLLPHGRYVFEVQAAVLDGPWGPCLQRELIVLPPVWLSGWAIACYVLAGLALLYLITTGYLRRKEAALVAENDERVNRLFELRQEARHHFAQSVQPRLKDIAANPREEELLNRIMAAVEQNLANRNYTVDRLAGDVCLSRASLYRAMNNILGISPNEFLRNIRLKQAAQMLTETDLSIGDISLRVGFGTPRYFTQHFKKMFGVLPSEYRQNSPKGLSHPTPSQQHPSA